MSTSEIRIITIIPARGGSKGIPRKNLRPLAGYPMIYYSIKAALSAKLVDQVVVSTDDDEIALFSERFGANIHMRSHALAGDSVPLDPVIADCVEIFEKDYERYTHIITIQPTSPLIDSLDIDSAIDKLIQERYDSVLTVTDDTHLRWGFDGEKPAPLYAERLNRQLLPKEFRETGAIIGCTREQLESGRRIGRNIGLIEVPRDKSYDIDDFSDFYLCESLLNRKKLVFVVTGYPEVGLGHAFRTLMLAHELVDFDITFICDSRSSLARDYIASYNYRVILVEQENIPGKIAELKPDLVINDILDTSKDYVNQIKRIGAKVVNFEDLGEGHLHADLVINALYPEESPHSHVLSGEQYFCLRDEFLYFESEYSLSENVSKILLTFGGVDEGNLTLRTVKSIYELCHLKDIQVDIVLGPGYQWIDSLHQYLESLESERINLVEKTKRISDYMYSADIAITSGGRTVLELASLGVPTIVVCQNARELTHTFASQENGVINLGLRTEVTESDIFTQVKKLVDSYELRASMSEKMKAKNLTAGKKRVVNKIRSLMAP